MKGKLSALACTIVGITIVTFGCSSSEPIAAYQKAQSLPSYQQQSFNQYVEETKQWLAENRVFITDDKQAELAQVLPKEYQPANPNGQGILLVHGLGDSPYSFVDVATHLASQGYLVRTILLPGHASKVGDLQLPTVEDWQGVVDHHIELLKKDTDGVWLGGYSTGANLVTTAALKDDQIEGLLLFSPALQPHSSSVQFAEMASYFVTGQIRIQKTIHCVTTRCQ
jgi:alpha-beta hydrolase superfamily lysophospholipase